MVAASDLLDELEEEEELAGIYERSSLGRAFEMERPGPDMRTAGRARPSSWRHPETIAKETAAVQQTDAPSPGMYQGSTDDAVKEAKRLEGIAGTQRAVKDAEAKLAARPQEKYALPGGERLVTDPASGESWAELPDIPASRGGWRPTGETVKGAMPVGPEHGQAENLAYLAERQAAREAYESQKAALNVEQSVRLGQQEALMERAREQEKENEQIAQQVGQLKYLHNNAQQDYESFKVDPEALYKRPDGTTDNWKKFRHRLSIALGAYSAARFGAQNPGLQLFMAERAQSVREQEAQRRVKGESANNALTRLEKEMGSLALAKKSLETIFTKVAANQVETMALMTKDADAQANYMKLNAELLREHSKNQLELEKMQVGEVTKNRKYFAGSAGRKGARRPLTMKEAADLQKLQAAGGGDASMRRLDYIQARLDTVPDEYVPVSKEYRHIGSRIFENVENYLAGGSHYARTEFSPEDLRRMQIVDMAVNWYTAADSILSGQGVLKEAEFQRAKDAASRTGKTGDLKKAVAELRASASEKGIDLDAEIQRRYPNGFPTEEEE